MLILQHFKTCVYSILYNNNNNNNFAFKHSNRYIHTYMHIVYVQRFNKLLLLLPIYILKYLFDVY